MQLNTAQKCVKRVQLEKSNNSAMVYRKIAKFYMDIDANLVYSQTGYDVTSQFRLAFIDVWKTAVNVASTALRINLSGMAFCLAQPIGGLLDEATVCAPYSMGLGDIW